MNRTLAVLVLAAFAAAPLALAQPAPNANPNAHKGALTPECQKLRDDYLKLQSSRNPERDDAHGGGGEGGGKGGAKGEGDRAAGMSVGNAELKAARQQYQDKCGEMPTDMMAGAQQADDDKKKDDGKPKNLAEAIKPEKKDQAQGAVTTAAGAATAGAANASAPVVRAEPYVPPRKAGPNMGTGSGSARCAQLHQSLKDSLARKEACGKDKGCKKGEETGYEQLRSAYQSGCGELPADAKPRKKG